MIAIHNAGGKCVLLCRDSSRLSRNPTHNVLLTDMLYGDNDFRGRRIIDKIYMLGAEGRSVVEWSAKTNKAEITKELHDNYQNSLSTAQKSGT